MRELTKKKNIVRKQEIARFAAGRGIEREIALIYGDIWVCPTTCMVLKAMYNRNQQKKRNQIDDSGI